ncbi:MAG TPA: hypothetical protein DEF00_02810 [Candidatus Taylorbacteria bacterium]|uniref:tRNA N6-adenosine threonylcarbamoyltransferase n=1 Tax=Candidatus Kaiserbacteria bacterium GW2011_GWA2_49_56 TaxID=1618670 RepID=A0A0G1Y3F2_9BACT|nr:MAG: O-sialoglycoprotein endopeptidase [Parcubacteria group bacterium GW2011_GWC2_48_17]KKW09422.1 MAG: O-sialoglycoprotein endopeptidase [Candidatus Kaiserbacteria bacterium GW2011_GWA2_49_56]HBV01300.1 hypothetical protein [Candidatus Taylorbacteria bacterium]
MIILGIETSCDETALALIEAEGDSVRVLANITHSQAALHAKYGGVFPNLAKREHSRNLIPLLKNVLTESGFGKPKSQAPDSEQIQSVKSKTLNAKRSTLNAILEREPELLGQFLEFIPTIEKPPIDAIAVTEGPGLEPCLWTGINLANALSLVWNIKVVPVNHMEGHIFSALMRRKECSANRITRSAREVLPLHAIRYALHAPRFPALALLISGGHTELVLIKSQFSYEIIGQTRDDAVGEAFDKVARLLGLPYPGGPEISRLAENARHAKQGSPLESGERSNLVLPRPMLYSGDYNFSFSGLKTAVLYTVKKIPKLTEKIKMELAKEFEDAVTEVLIAKTKKAMEHYDVKALLIGGGVIANKHIRRAFEDLANTYDRMYLLKEEKFLHIPEANLTTDNALMIAVAGLIQHMGGRVSKKANLTARGNLRLT